MKQTTKKNTPTKGKNTPTKDKKPGKARQVDNAKKESKKATKKQVIAKLDKGEYSEQVAKIANTHTWAELLQSTYDCMITTSDFSDISEVFNAMYPLVKDTHKYPDGKLYTAKTNDTLETVWNILSTLATLPDITLEMVGRFMWLSGKQKQHAKVLSSLGFTYQKNKQKYCRSYSGYKRIQSSDKKYTYGQIKSMYGTTDEATA